MSKRDGVMMTVVDKLDLSKVSAPKTMDGDPVDKEEAARTHAGLVSGEIKMVFGPEALEEMKAIGITEDQVREMIIASTKKTMS